MDSLGAGTGTGVVAGAPDEVFALTDEQIVGLEPEEVASGEWRVASPEKRAQDPPSKTEGGAPAGVPVPPEAPGWLAERMRDPWHGEEAKEFWEGAQRVEREAAAYREVFATPEDARAIREIYPGGVREAKAAAEQARELNEIDAAFYRGDAATRTALAQRMMEQNPAAFREMVEAGVRLLGRVPSGQRPVTRETKEDAAETQRSAERGGEEGNRRMGSSDREASQDASAVPRSLRSEPANGAGSTVGMTEGELARTARASGPFDSALLDIARGRQGRRDDNGEGRGGERKDLTPEGVSYRGDVPRDVARAYGEFEKTANAELEKSVGGAIGRAMEQALPNLMQAAVRGQDGGVHAPLQERLAGAVREEVETALKSDRALGEQVARILAGRRFGERARAQVVRLIDTRAQQLVPGAVKRVVGAWTQATLGARGKRERDGAEERASGQKTNLGQTASRGAERSGVKAQVQTASLGQSRGRKIDYGRVSDEEILGL